jgi:hypothetical protein
MCSLIGTTEGATEKNKVRKNEKLKESYANLCEKCIHEEVQKATENFIAHQDSDVEVGNDDGSGVFNTVRPMS